MRDYSNTDFLVVQRAVSCGKSYHCLSVGWGEPSSSRPELGIPVQSLKTPEPKGSSSFSFTLESLFGNKVCKYAFKSSNPAWLDLKQDVMWMLSKSYRVNNKNGRNV